MKISYLTKISLIVLLAITWSLSFGKDRISEMPNLNHFKLDPYGKGHEGLLFNLKEDPRQSNNLYDKFPERVIKMRSLLKEYLSGKPCAPTKQ
jgi:hypothetical protein